MNKNPLINNNSVDTTILTFDWSKYESLKDEKIEKGSDKAKFMDSFVSKLLFTRILSELEKIPLDECSVEHNGEVVPIVVDGIVNGGRFISLFKEEIYGKFPGVQLTSAAAITFMAMIAHESRSNMISGSQSSSPELCAAVPPILVAFKKQYPYSAWKIASSVAPFLLGKDLANAVSQEDAMNEAVEEILAIQNAKDLSFEAFMSIVTPAKNRVWEPRNIPLSFQVPKPKTGEPILATNYNMLDGFQRSMILNLWFFKHDHPDMIVNINDFDSRERMWMPVDTKREVEAQTDNLFSLLKNIKNPYIPDTLETVLLKKKVKTPGTRPSDEDAPW